MLFLGGLPQAAGEEARLSGGFFRVWKVHSWPEAEVARPQAAVAEARLPGPS